MAIRVSIQREDFDLAAETARLAGGGDVGAVVVFTGICRSEGGRLKALELEHYPDMAEEEIGRIAGEAARRWPVSEISVIHRYGIIPAGGNIVLVVTAASHRGAAFAAAEFLMDYLKTRAPFWKKEHLTREDGGWVAAAGADDSAAARWTKTETKAG